MRLPSPRISVRGLMAVVAIMAVAIGGQQMWTRWKICTDRATDMANVEKGYRQRIQNARLTAEILRSPPASEADLDRLNAQMDSGGLGCVTDFIPWAYLQKMSEAERLSVMHTCLYDAESFEFEMMEFARRKEAYRRVARAPWLSLPEDPDLFVDSPGAQPPEPEDPAIIPPIEAAR